MVVLCDDQPTGDLLVAGEDPRDPNARDTLSSRTDVLIRIWPVRNGQTGQDSFVIRQPGARTWTNAIRFSSDGRLMAVALNSGPIGLWRMDSSTPELLQTLNRFEGIVTALAISPDGRYLAAAKRDKGQPVVVWNIENPQSPTESKTWDVPAPQEPSALIFSQDSQTLFIGAGGAQVSTGEIYRWSYLAENSAQPFFETPSQSPGVIPVHPYVRSLALSRDGKKLAAAFSTLCFVIDADSGTLTQTFRGHSKPVISIGFAGQDSQCLSAGFDQSIRLWNISDGVQVWQNPSVTGSNEGLAISSDHRIAFSTSHQGTGNSRQIDGNVAQLWRLPDTQLSVSPKLPSAVNPVQGLTLNPAFNGRDLAGWKSFGGGTWTWENQELVGSPSPMGTPGFLMTESDYQDFEIRFDVFPYHGTNSGLFLRANPDGEPGGAGQIELQIIDDQYPQFKDAPYKTGALHGTFPTEADPGIRIRDWNSVRVRIEGRRLQAWINGQQTQNCDLNSVRDQFAAKPWLTRASGRIGLQISGNAQVRFRNVEILGLNSPQETVSEEDDSQPLFNGTDLTGWTTEGDVNHWNVVSGELQIANTALSRRGMLRTTSDYSDFLLTFEARMSVNVDAGITFDNWRIEKH